MPWLSVVMPALNEADGIAARLEGLQGLRAEGGELIVVDGGSDDATVERAGPLADLVLVADRGRARQMNAGAAVASGRLLLFLHADTQLPADFLSRLRAFLHEPGHAWGRFDVRLSGEAGMFRLIERMMNWRSRLTGIATGDQAIFARREVFEQLAGFADIPLMEDVELCSRLRRLSRPCCLSPPVITSSRRWEEQGIWRTIFLMWRLRLAYFLGVSPERLVMSYYGRR